MKKIIVLLITLVLVLSLGACENAPSNTELEERVTVLEEQVLELEQILVNLQVIEGLNGQREYYLPSSTQSLFTYTSVGAASVEVLGTELDKTKAPTYVLDINGDYISFKQVANLLVDKYFGEDVTVNIALIGFQIKLSLSYYNMTEDEYVAKLIMLIEELSYYDFYIIGGSELYIQLDNSNYGYIKIPIQTMRSSFITITPEVIYTGLYEVVVFQLEYTDSVVATLYDEYVASGLYAGFVLNYN